MDDVLTITIYETPCQIFSLETCPFGGDFCDECEEFLDELEIENG